MFIVVDFFFRLVMPLKQQQDKAAWQWAEQTDPQDITFDHVKTAYRLDLKPCPVGACRRNCKGNPFCLNGIGERQWFREIDERNWNDIEDPNNDRRNKGMFVGLKNLGATCYVNTFLQLWFQNVRVRQAIYSWRKSVNDDTEATVLPEWSPNSICEHLQVIFAMLELSVRRFIDPSPLINHLRLDAREQQDAQEFSKLFLSSLEASLSDGKDCKTQSIIQKQFCGQYTYVTTCDTCNGDSKNSSTFYELDLNIKGQKTLEDCIRDFLKEEKLEADNQYMCTNCGSKQNATRKICIDKIPPVLNLQLLRFVFDKKTWQKKKLNNFIQFPSVLDMGHFMSQPEGTILYDLTAVLIHRGPTAYSGHYIAHIKDPKGNAWYKFNDEEIEQFKGRNLQLGSEDDPEDGVKQQRGRTPKGYHSTRNAYMLVYTRNDAGTCPVNGETVLAKELVPKDVLHYVDKDNEKFENWVLDLLTMREHNIEKGMKQQQEIKDLYDSLTCKDTDNLVSCEWISLRWLNKWLADPDKIKSVSKDQFLCQHGKLLPDSTPKLKCVSTIGASKVSEHYSFGSRLNVQEMLCFNCVRVRCHITRTKKQMVEDERYFNTRLKSCFEPDLTNWVGKQSLRSWKRLALEQLEQDPEEEEEEHKSDTSSANGEYDQNLENITDEQLEEEQIRGLSLQEAEEKPQEDVTKKVEKESILRFNEDLLCEHGNLCVDLTVVGKLITADVWQRLQKYFPNCPTFTRDSGTCDVCRLSIYKEQQNIDSNRMMALEQKTALPDLFNDRRRPLLENGTPEINVISTMFLQDWRKFVKDPSKREPITNVLNKLLLCEHGGFLYPVDLMGVNAKQGDVTFLWPEEWTNICKMFNFDTEIKITQANENGHTIYSTIPDICPTCVADSIERQEKEKFEYDSAVVYVAKAPKEASAKGMPASPSLDDTDPDYGTVTSLNNPKKRKKVTEDQPLKMPRLEESADSVRRSSRRKNRRGEKEVKISSDQTLKEFKLKLMSLFSVPPFDQNLLIDGQLLSGDSATLGQLRVYPGAFITLKADEPVENPMLLEDLYQVSSTQETGFKGTSLLST